MKNNYIQKRLLNQRRKSHVQRWKKIRLPAYFLKIPHADTENVSVKFSHRLRCPYKIQFYKSVTDILQLKHLLLSERSTTIRIFRVTVEYTCGYRRVYVEGSPVQIPTPTHWKLKGLSMTVPRL